MEENARNKRSILPRAKFHATKKAGVFYLVAGDGEKHFCIRCRTPDGRRKLDSC